MKPGALSEMYRALESDAEKKLIIAHLKAEIIINKAEAKSCRRYALNLKLSLLADIHEKTAEFLEDEIKELQK